jgi:hypothetical protein
VNSQTATVASSDTGQSLKYMWNALSAWTQTTTAKRMGFAVRVFLTLALIGYVGWQLMHFGWQNMANSLPTSAWFFLSFTGCYLIAPIADFLIYKHIWQLGLSDLPAFFRKRSLNEAVMDYSGEAWLFVWAKNRNLDSGVEVARSVRDVNLLSGVASNLVTLASLAFIMATGAAEKLLKVRASLTHDMLFGAAAVIVLAAIVIGFRRFFFTMPWRLQLYTSAIHAFRNILVMAVTLLMWHFALPDIAYADWFVFLSLQLLAYRFPFIPNRDLLMAGVGMALAPSLGSSATAAAAMFAMVGGLFLICNLAMVAVTSSITGAARTSNI